MTSLTARFAALAALAISLALPLQPARSAGDWPRTIAHEGGELVLASAPQRIVSTTPSLTGILLAMNAPVAASAATSPGPLTDSKGFFSQWAAEADARGVEVLCSNLAFDLEAVIGSAPDLVVVSATGADSVKAHLDELQAQELPVILVNYSNQSWQAVARQLGEATGLEGEAEAAIRRFDAVAAQTAQAIVPPEGSVSIVGYNIGGSYSIGKPDSPHARLLSSLGMAVTGLPDSMRGQVTRSSDFDLISLENLPAAIQGETVFLLRATDKDVEAFLADPILANLPAVRSRQVYPLGPSSHRIDYYSGQEIMSLIAARFARPRFTNP